MAHELKAPASENQKQNWKQKLPSMLLSIDTHTAAAVNKLRKFPFLNPRNVYKCANQQGPASLFEQIYIYNLFSVQKWIRKRKAI